MHAGELPAQDIAHRFGVSRSTLYRNAAGPESPNVLKTNAKQTEATNEILRGRKWYKQAATKPWNGHA
jgi:Helix-turn-helix domain of resolvase